MKRLIRLAALAAFVLAIGTGAAYAKPAPAADPAPHTESSQPHDEAHASTGLPQMDMSTFPSQLFWLAASFLTLFLLMWRVALPSVAGTLARREETLQKAADAATEARVKAESLRDQSNALTFGANDDVKKLMDQLNKDIQAEQQKRNKELTDQLDARKAEAEKSINDVIAEAEHAIPAEAAEIAKAAIEKLTSLRPAAEQMRNAVHAAPQAGIQWQGAA